MEIGVAEFTPSDQSVSGDLHLVRYAGERLLLAVIDGIGHGESAAAAAKKVTSVLEQKSADTLEAMMREAHEALRATRGAVVTMASIDSENDTMRWLGVGNVQGVLQRAGSPKGTAQEILLLRAGVVGSQLPLLHAATLPLKPGDTLVFATDGVGGDFVSELSPLYSAQRSADRILQQNCRGTDDSLVLVARYLGRAR